MLVFNLFDGLFELIDHLLLMLELIDHDGQLLFFCFQILVFATDPV